MLDLSLQMRWFVLLITQKEPRDPLVFRVTQQRAGGQNGILSFSWWSLTGLPSIPTETTELWIWSETTQSSTNTRISVKQSPLTHDLRSEGSVKYLSRLWFWEYSSFPGILNNSGFIDNAKTSFTRVQTADYISARHELHGSKRPCDPSLWRLRKPIWLISTAICTCSFIYSKTSQKQFIIIVHIIQGRYTEI